jgi:glucose-6-phosphate isomerase
MPTPSSASTSDYLGLPGRIWATPPDPLAFVDPTSMSADDLAAAEASIRNRLGWLAAPEAMATRLGELEDVASALERDGISQIHLLGMGGSSLCAEVIRELLVPRPGIELVVLDTTDETAVRHATGRLQPHKACFIVASKSGSTVEVTSLERHFWDAMAAATPTPGRHFIAITDPGTSLVSHAASRGYRHSFVNPADIGGRYSALSLFGLVPARLAGIRPELLLQPSAEMARSCREAATTNPGLALGVFMGGQAASGRDKLTLITSPALAPFGVWVEQLVAESTGKRGLGVLPIVDEPVGPASEYGPDRAFVVMTTRGDAATTKHGDDLERAGHPVLRIETEPARLGAEFFRWEFATAVAGAVLRVNPFDEPDVRKAKVFTKAQLDAHAATGAFAADPAFSAAGAYSRREHPGAAGRRQEYIAILDYLPADGQRSAHVARVRAALRAQVGVPTTYGVGPRYLHSTGQYHKGGPNTGTFVILTADDRTVTNVPGEAYSFSVLKRAQAFGDFDALREAGRRVVHCHVGDPEGDYGATLERIVTEQFAGR